jgi:hypothetical protein
MNAAAAGCRHLIHAGYPKTGSKLLQAWFAVHPGLAYAPWGIAGFADAHGLASAAAGTAGDAGWHVTSHEALLTPVADLRDPGGQSGAPALPTRAAQDRACDLLAALFPQATILVVTRGFAGLLRSFHGELVLGGAGGGFEIFCAALHDRIRAGRDPFHLDHVLGRYAAAFGEDRLIVLPYELLRDRPAAFFGHLEARLGIEPFPFATAPMRPSPPPGRLEVYRRLTRLVRRVPGSPAFRARLGRSWVAALRSGRLDPLARFLESPEPAQALPAELVASLAGRAERLRGDALYAGLEEDYWF